MILPRVLGWDIHQNDDFFLAFLVATHLAVRRSERAQLAGVSPEEACRRYAAVI